MHTLFHSVLYELSARFSMLTVSRVHFPKHTIGRDNNLESGLLCNIYTLRYNGRCMYKIVGVTKMCLHALVFDRYDLRNGCYCGFDNPLTNTTIKPIPQVISQRLVQTLFGYHFVCAPNHYGEECTKLAMVFERDVKVF